MKGLLRTYLFHLAALLFLTNALPQVLKINGGLQTLLIAALILALFNVLLKPILKLLFLPINALTLGLFSFVINAGVFFLFLKAIPQVILKPWDFPGLVIFGFTVPAAKLSFIVTLILISLIQVGITNFLVFLVD